MYSASHMYYALFCAITATFRANNQTHFDSFSYMNDFCFYAWIQQIAAVHTNTSGYHITKHVVYGVAITRFEVQMNDIGLFLAWKIYICVQ